MNNGRNQIPHGWTAVIIHSNGTNMAPQKVLKVLTDHSKPFDISIVSIYLDLRDNQIIFTFNYMGPLI